MATLGAGVRLWEIGYIIPIGQLQPMATSLLVGDTGITEIALGAKTTKMSGSPGLH